MMRYANAAHVDHSGLLGRRPQLGAALALVGGLLIPVSISGAAQESMSLLLLVTFLLWLLTWYLAVGILFRLPYSAAVLIQLIIITCQQLEYV